MNKTLNKKQIFKTYDEIPLVFAELEFDDVIDSGSYGFETVVAFEFSNEFAVVKLFVEFAALVVDVKLVPEVTVDGLDVPMLVVFALVDSKFTLGAGTGAATGAGCLERVVNLNLLTAVVAFLIGDARSCSKFSSNFFIALTYDAFELSSLSMSSVSKELLPLCVCGDPYLAYNSSIDAMVFGLAFGCVNIKSSASKSSKKSSVAFSFFNRSVTVLKPCGCSSSLKITQSDPLLTLLTFSTLFVLSLAAFKVLVSIVFGLKFEFGRDFGLNLNLSPFFVGAGAAVEFALFLF